MSPGSARRTTSLEPSGAQADSCAPVIASTVTAPDPSGWMNVSRYPSGSHTTVGQVASAMTPAIGEWRRTELSPNALVGRTRGLGG